MAISGGPSISETGLTLLMDIANPKSFRGEETTNLIVSTSVGPGIYNNPGFSSSFRVTSDTFKGATVYEIIFVPQSSSFIPRLGSTEGFGFYHTMPALSASVYYIASVYFKTDFPLPTSSTEGFANTYSNISTWGTNGTGTTRYREGDWYRLYSQFYTNVNGYASRTLTYPGQYGSGMTYIVNTVATQNVDVKVTVSASATQVPDFTYLYAIVGANPTILANGGLTGLSVVDHGLDTASFTKLTYSSSIKLKAELPFDYFVRLSVPSTSGVDTSIRIASNFVSYTTNITDQKYWKPTFDTASLANIPVGTQIKTYWAAPMIEIKTGSNLYPSEFTWGTRGNAVSASGGLVNLIRNNFDAAVVNTPAYQISSSGVLSFDGINDYVSVPNFTSSVQNSSAFTMGLFFNMTTLDTLRGLIGTLNYTCGQNIGIVASSTTLEFYNDTGTCYSVQLSNWVQTNKWLYAVATYDGTTSSIYGIKDGVLTKNTGTTKSGLTNVFSSDFRIMGNQYASYFTSGKFSNAFVYNRALSETEILEIFNSKRSRFGI